MPARKKTNLIKLNLWEGQEYPKRLDFVEDNQATEGAIATFDWLQDQPGVEYDAKSTGTGEYDAWEETLTMDSKQIAKRESTENAKGWVVVVNITVPDRPAKTYTTTWTEANGTWKGVTA